jgi:pyridoxal phosphate enzyme (YggS family)
MLGENYAQELEAKAAQLADSVVEPEWHFIGRLQRNKVRRIADVVTSWDSVDRSELLGEIAKRAPGARVLLQVNVSDEPGKGGCEPAELDRLLATAADAQLQVDGLMTVGRTGDPEEARPGFRLLRRLCDENGLRVCSMGMSNDLDVAVDEGSTLVRVGTALFGPRLRR